MDGKGKKKRLDEPIPIKHRPPAPSVIPAIIVAARNLFLYLPLLSKSSSTTVVGGILLLLLLLLPFPSPPLLPLVVPPTDDPVDGTTTILLLLLGSSSVDEDLSSLSLDVSEIAGLGLGVIVV